MLKKSFHEVIVRKTGQVNQIPISDVTESLFDAS